MEDLRSKIENWLHDKLSEDNLFLADIVIGANFKIQVFIDKIPFINIAECAKVSRFLEKFLDEDPSIPENYNLEVSSPGMTNALKVPLQYKKRIGSILKIQTEQGEEFAVIVQDADEEKIIAVKTALPDKKSKLPKKKVAAKENEQSIELKYTDIKQAKLHFNI
jgi:ribosome maturation factor RimP